MKGVMEAEEEEMKCLGIIGIYREAYRMIFSWREIFTQLTFAFILPLSFIFLAHIEVSDYLLAKIIHDQNKLAETQIGTLKHNRTSRLLDSEYAALCLVKAAYFLFTCVFSLLSTSAITFTIACIYTGQKVSFTKVLTVVPKVLKRLILTFLAVFSVLIAYHMVAALLLITWVGFLEPTNTHIIILFVLFVFYVGGLIYMGIVWNLADTISVLEDSYGFQAMHRSRELIKGKVGVTVFVCFKLGFSYIIIQAAFQKLVVHGESLDLFDRTVYAIICFLLHVKLVLLGHVLRTVIYLVCKFHHNESIDKLALSDHLDAYSNHQDEYAPLKGEDVKPGQLLV